MRIIWPLICLLILVKSVVLINLIMAESFHGLDHIITAHAVRWGSWKCAPAFVLRVTDTSVMEGALCVLASRLSWQCPWWNVMLKRAFYKEAPANVAACFPDRVFWGYGCCKTRVRKWIMWNTRGGQSDTVEPRRDVCPFYTLQRENTQTRKGNHGN